MKIWQKNKDNSLMANKKVETYTVGDDYILDQELLLYDCQASLAHAQMLRKIGVLKRAELESLKIALEKIKTLFKQGKFKLTVEDEDCHSAIESFLIKECGESGKKIHTGRSRNDQVLTALRLYQKDELKVVEEKILKYKKALKNFVQNKNNRGVVIPGYTHMQKAMPLNLSHWAGSFIESAEENLFLLKSVYFWVDNCPLGTAAGFGVPSTLAIDREFTKKALAFKRKIKHPPYAQMSRGKVESLILHLLLQIMFDLNKLSSDIILFSMAEFRYFLIDEQLCTGSSIMPQKKNPDILELVRAHYATILGESVKVNSLISNLISGYNRDLQLTKGSIINAFRVVKSSIDIMILVISTLKVNKEACKKALTKELYATEEAMKLVANQGMSFREAYRLVGSRYQLPK